jgi:hypothetical protein
LLLGYPACCAEAFPDLWATARGTSNGNVVEHLLDAEMAAECNAFVRVLGAELPVHFPCSARCSATADTVLRQLAVLERVEPSRAELTRELLKAPTIVGPNGDVTALVGGRVGADRSTSGELSYDPAFALTSDRGSPVWALVEAGRADAATRLPGARIVIPRVRSIAERNVA